MHSYSSVPLLLLLLAICTWMIVIKFTLIVSRKKRAHVVLAVKLCSSNYDLHKLLIKWLPNHIR